MRRLPGGGREIGIRKILEFNRPLTHGLLPDRTFLLVLDPELAERRAGGWPSWIARENEAFRGSIKWGYREVARMFPDRVLSVDSSRPTRIVADEIYEQARALYGPGPEGVTPPGDRASVRRRDR